MDLVDGSEFAWDDGWVATGADGASLTQQEHYDANLKALTERARKNP